jgi:O-acetyl-ADP-ribose deacetylase
MSSGIQVHQVCKVRNTAIRRSGNGYSLAVFKKSNKTNAQILLIDPAFVPGSELLNVPLDTLWKLKASQRKTLERKVFKACKASSVMHPAVWALRAPVVAPVAVPIVPPPAPLPTIGKVKQTTQHLFGLQMAYEVELGASGALLYTAYDSVLKFTGDAVVNAANVTCLGGGGIDGMVNSLGGNPLQEARKALPLVDSYSTRRCETGDAKITIAGNLPCSKVIHAVGPCFKTSNNGIKDACVHLLLLEQAYKNSMERAREHGLKSVGFCIISAGIYRGSCPLDLLIKTAINSFAKYAYPGLETVVFCAYSSEEVQVVDDVVSSLLLRNTYPQLWFDTFSVLY